MLLLVGLGNPGPRHANNRHNIGFMAVDEIVRCYSFGAWRNRFQARIAEGRIGGEKLLAMEPQTYMNLSGQAVGEALRFYKLEPGEVIVLHDEIDLKAGRVKVKQGGGAGGHNGLRSIDQHIGPNYWRVRLGVGHPGDKDLVHDHVLHDFAKAEQAWLEKLLDAIAKELPLLIAADDKAFMSKVNQVLVPPRSKSPRPNPPEAGDAPEAPQTHQDPKDTD